MKKFIPILLILAAIGLLAVFLLGRGEEEVPETSIVEIAGDPMDAALEFYTPWHEAVLSTTTDPVTAGLLEHPRLAADLRPEIEAALSDGSAEVEPVLCQTEAPPRIGTKLSYVLDNEAEVHVLARGLAERSPRVAVVKLTGVDGEWVISDISCSNAESAPEREFTFDREGFLLKSVPPPLNPDFWHLVFEENGVNGHTAPLFFSENSTCIEADGSEAACNPDSFTDATPALVQGEMTEAGVNVQKVTFQ